jgi:oxygen-independent coproporphyrinogen-3 oxidase
MGETMMLGLRLLQEGVPFTRFRARHGGELREFFGRELADLWHIGLLTLDDERVRLTRRGLLLGNQVFARFMPDTQNTN